MESISEKANKAMDNYQKIRGEAIQIIRSNPDSITVLHTQINRILLASKKALYFTENEYCKKNIFENPTFETHTDNSKHFNSPQCAKLFDVLSEMFGGDNNNLIYSIIALVECYAANK